jgi:pimeloyl-ACP methyl ester carboxylesterase
MHRFEIGRPERVLSVVLLAVLCAFALAFAGSVAACGDEASAPTATGAGTSSTTTGGATAGTSRPVTFAAEDGVTLSGHLFGNGAAGVILAHMYPADQTSWYPTATRLAQEGYLVLTFDFRGYGESEGSKDIQYLDRDVLAALFAIADAGASRVVMVGASMGGTACLIAADTSQALSRLQVTGVVTLSAPVEFKGLSATEAVPKLQMPLLLIAGEDDEGADGAKALRELSGNTADLQIVPGDDHGTDLLEGSQADRVWALLLGFIEQNLPVSSR